MFFVTRGKFNRLLASQKFWKNATKEWERLSDLLGDENRKLQKENNELIEDLTDEQNISNDLRRQLADAKTDLRLIEERLEKINHDRDPKTGRFISVSKPDNDFDPKKKSHYEGGF